MFLQAQKLFTPPFAASHSSFHAYTTKKAQWKSFTPNFAAIQASMHTSKRKQLYQLTRQQRRISQRMEL